MLALIILLALVGLGQEVVATEGLSAVFALEWQEVDKIAHAVSALLADVEHGVIAVGGVGGHGEG